MHGPAEVGVDLAFLVVGQNVIGGSFREETNQVVEVSLKKKENVSQVPRPTF